VGTDRPQASQKEVGATSLFHDNSAQIMQQPSTNSTKIMTGLHSTENKENYVSDTTLRVVENLRGPS
jgi:hypothetical protein